MAAGVAEGVLEAAETREAGSPPGKADSIMLRPPPGRLGLALDTGEEGRKDCRCGGWLGRRGPRTTRTAGERSPSVSGSKAAVLQTQGEPLCKKTRKSLVGLLVETHCSCSAAANDLQIRVCVRFESFTRTL